MTRTAGLPEIAGISLRHTTPGDDEFLFALYASTRQEELAAWGWPESQQQIFLRMQFAAVQQRYLAERAASQDRIILLNRQPAGRIIVVRSPEEIRLADIALLPEHRGRGIGSAFVTELQREAAAAGLPLRLHVTRDNRAAELYRRLGFAVIEELGGHFKMEWRTPQQSGGIH